MPNNPVCQCCKGDRFVEVTLRDLSGKQRDGCGVQYAVACEMCNGKGYTTQEDHDRYLRSVGWLDGER
jgi:hypothetical protein